METEAPPDDPVYGPVRDPARDRTLLAVKDRLHASPVRFSHVIEVTFVADDPLRGRRGGEQRDGCLHQGSVRREASPGRARRPSFWRSEAADLRRQVHQREERIVHLPRRACHEPGHARRHRQRANHHLAEDLVKAQSSAAAANARLDAARGKAGREAQAAVAPSVVQLRAQLDQLAGQMQAQRSRLGSAHPEVQSLNRQFAEGQRALNAEIARVVAATDGGSACRRGPGHDAGSVCWHERKGDGTKCRQGADPARMP